MKVSLFLDSENGSAALASYVGEDEREVFCLAIQGAVSYLHSCGIAPPYLRFWSSDAENCPGLMIDYGSHSKFLRLSPVPSNINYLFDTKEGVT